MHIYLQAILPGGDLANVGQYGCDVVPRIGEHIILWLHDGYISAADSNKYAPQLSARFRVVDVTYSTYNWLATEEWMKPYKDMSNSVTVDVSADDDESKKYLKRLAEKERNEDRQVDQ